MHNKTTKSKNKMSVFSVKIIKYCNEIIVYFVSSRKNEFFWDQIVFLRFRHKGGHFEERASRTIIFIAQQHIIIIYTV